MPLQPDRVKFRKMHRGSRAGLAYRGCTVAFGEYGLMALERCWLDTKQIDPPITIRVEPEPAQTLSLEKWREMMLQARLESLGFAGVYLDRSPTGSGKSHVDFAAVQALLKREGAA